MPHDAIGEGDKGSACGVKGRRSPEQIKREILLEIISVHSRNGPIASQSTCVEADIVEDAPANADGPFSGVH
jgi:hypothetical protein